MEAPGQGLHAQPEDARNLGELQAEEIFHLSAGDQNGDSVGEADHHWPGNKLHSRAHAGDAHDHEQNSSHHCAHEESVDAVHRDDAGHDDDEGASWSANLSFGAAQRGDQKAGDDGAVNAGLRRESGGNRKGHSQGQRHQSHGDAGDQIVDKFVGAVVAQTEDRLRKPTLVNENNRHFPIMRQACQRLAELCGGKDTKEHGRWNDSHFAESARNRALRSASSFGTMLHGMNKTLAILAVGSGRGAWSGCRGRDRRPSRRADQRAVAGRGRDLLLRARLPLLQQVHRGENSCPGWRCARLPPSDWRMAAIFLSPTSGSCSDITSRRSPGRVRWWGRCWRRSSDIFPERCGCWPARCSPAACRIS